MIEPPHQEDASLIIQRVIPPFLFRMICANYFHVHRFISFVAKDVPCGGRILDAGAGECPHKKFFRNHRYFACDLGKGSRLWDYTGLDFLSDLETLSLATGTFDAVLSLVTLEHVKHPGVVLKELARILKPGGRLYLVVPQEWKLHMEPFHYFNFTKYGIRLLLEDAGLEVVSTDNMGGYFQYMGTRLSESTMLYLPFMKGWPSRILLFPFFAVHGAIFSILLPILLFPLDSLDREHLHPVLVSAVAEKKQNCGRS